VPLPRFRIRTLMIAVAAVGGAAAGIVEYQRLTAVSRSYRARAATCAGEASLCLRVAARAKSSATVSTYFHRASDVRSGNHEDYDRTVDPKEREEAAAANEKLAQHMVSFAALRDARAQYYSDLAAKYRRAARYPWLPVPPDPPEPSDAVPRTGGTAAGSGAEGEDAVTTPAGFL